ncbi:hypothetical protein H6P81_017658 [Aristolochia fimbriata]|uniref:Uncharacterized protein n=1 Tax=Aristolochia fimbriata TaxID=158543 RepID=A0AAV7E0L4_ARIFI|nr:hypothetical protein H6P81_017658 [Aristolochia fimbriata]
MARIPLIQPIILLLPLLLWELGFAEVDPVLSRKDVPFDFIFGVGTSGYHVPILSLFYHNGVLLGWGITATSLFRCSPYEESRMLYKGNEDVAIDQYHKFKVEFMPNFTVRGIWQRWRESYPSDRSKVDDVTVFTGLLVSHFNYKRRIWFGVFVIQSSPNSEQIEKFKVALNAYSHSKQ